MRAIRAATRRAASTSTARRWRARGGNRARYFRRPIFDALKFKPETVDAFELGAKFNGPGVDVNVALFHQLFKNFQLNTFNGLNFVVENINSCSDDLNGADTDNLAATGACTGSTRAGVRSQGFELEVFARPIATSRGTLGVDVSRTRNTAMI